MMRVSTADARASPTPTSRYAIIRAGTSSRALSYAVWQITPPPAAEVNAAMKGTMINDGMWVAVGSVLWCSLRCV